MNSPLFRFTGGIMLAFLGFTGMEHRATAGEDNSGALKVGSTVPSAVVERVDGKRIDIAELVQGTPTVLLFYRGGWCPYCTKHLKEIKNIEADLNKLGYQILALSADRPERVAEGAKKHNIGYTLLSDSKMNAATAFGLSITVDDATKEKYRQNGIDLAGASGETHGMLPVPAAFVVDSEGTVRYAYANADYKVRVDVKALLAAAREATTRDLSIYDFVVTDAEGGQVNLGSYRGKVLLIVNTASKCGFTGQYEGLQKLHEKYQGAGFSVLAFPCNQFGGQEPGSNEQIQAFCTGKFGVTFPVYAKVDVNGKNADPLYTFLKKQAPGAMGTGAIKWNFTKFLVDKDGTVIDRYSSRTKPAKLEGIIEKLLDEK